ncbi:unnamed protein product [Cuscuta europaea]|uniref:DUF1985 domain-containing protein n=1 Tax=Cuscuta europaea TaxID=41803 RepID=A0A9P1A089_CUSEU|nr:unnamed protein product [Cuscuta europaea]
MQFSAQLIHLLLLRLVCDQPEDEIWFDVKLASLFLERVKLGSLFLVHCCLLARDQPTRIHPDYLRLVDDFKLFKSCPWSLESYKEMVKSLKKTMQGQPKFVSGEPIK